MEGEEQECVWKTLLDVGLLGLERKGRGHLQKEWH